MSDEIARAFIGGLLSAQPDDLDTVDEVLLDVRDTDVADRLRPVLRAVRSIRSDGDDPSDPALWVQHVTGPELDRAAKLVDLVPDASRLRAHARKILERRRERRIAEIGQELVQADGKIDPSRMQELRTELADCGAQSGGRRYRLIPAAEVEGRDPPEFLVGDTITVGSLVQFVGAPGACKSHLAVDTAYSVAEGVESVLGPVHSPGHAVYIAREGQAGYTWRLPAWRALHGIPAPSPRLHFIEQPISMNDPADVSDLIRDVTSALDGDLRLVVVDTVRRCLDGSEKEIEDVQAFVAGCARIQEEFGATVIGCHHMLLTGSRESGPWRGFLDTQINLTAEGEGLEAKVTAKIEKQKDGEDGRRIPLRLVRSLDSVALVRTDNTQPLSVRVARFVRSNPSCSLKMVLDAIEGRAETIRAEVIRQLESGALMNLGNANAFKLVSTEDHPTLEGAA